MTDTSSQQLNILYMIWDIGSEYKPSHHPENTVINPIFCRQRTNPSKTAIAEEKGVEEEEEERREEVEQRQVREEVAEQEQLDTREADSVLKEVETEIKENYFFFSSWVV